MEVSSLRLARVRKGYSQMDLFLKTNIPQWKISLLERGLRPWPHEAEKLAAALGEEVRDLFPPLEATK